MKIKESSTLSANTDNLLDDILAELNKQFTDKISTIFDTVQETSYEHDAVNTRITSAIKLGIKKGSIKFAKDNNIIVNDVLFVDDIKENSAKYMVQTKIIYLPSLSISDMTAEIITDLQNYVACPADIHYDESLFTSEKMLEGIQEAIKFNCMYILKKLVVSILHETVHAGQKGLDKASNYKAPTNIPDDEVMTPAMREEYAKIYKSDMRDPSEIDAWANQYVAEFILHYGHSFKPQDMKKEIEMIVRGYSSNYDEASRKKFAKAVYKAFQLYVEKKHAIGK